uniref:Uncharacterized protein n=1 Tax=Kalanchoe fedtschenkoi TaxID=63787 RepID=A0A7N0T834_KALFE
MNTGVKMQFPPEYPTSKSQKKQSVAKKNQASQLRGNNMQLLQDVHLPATLRNGQGPSKRSMHNLAPASFVKQERTTSDSLPESSSGDDGYRLLRRKYLMLEEESFLLGRETMEIEDQVKSLENEKLALLDQLVVLEGLVDPSEFKPLAGSLP